MGSRFGRSTFRILASGLVGLALVSGAAAGIFAQHTSSASAVKKTQVVKGGASHVARSGVVDVSKLPLASAQAGVNPAAKLVKTDRALKTPAQLAAIRAYDLAHLGALPKATAVAPAPKGANMAGNGSIPVLLSSHAGLTSVQGGGWYPPDQAIGVAPGYVFEGVNNVMAVYSSSTYAIKYGPWTPDALFASVKTAGDFFSDPQITWDPSRGHWLIVWLEINPANGADYIDIAISKSSTPNLISSFYVYQTYPQVANADYFCDYPTMGYDYWGMYVTCVTFSIAHGNFLGNDTYAYNITNMASGSLGAYDYWYSIPTDLNSGATPAYRLSPTMEDGVPQAEWVSATDAGWGALSSNLTLCSITNTHAVGTATLPTYTCSFNSLPLQYDDPNGAAQPGTAATVYPGYGYKQVAYRNGQLYFALPIAISCSGNLHDGIMWAAVDPQLNTIASASPQTVNGIYANYSQAGYWCYSNADAYMPTVMAGQEGDVAMVFNVSSSGIYPGIIYTGRAAADAPGSMGQGGNAAWVVIGSNSNDSGRWGDYSACALLGNFTTRGIVYCGGEFGGTNTALGGFGWDTELYALRME